MATNATVAERREGWNVGAEQARIPSFDGKTDEDIVLEAQAGSETALNFILGKYQRLVHHWIRPYFLPGAEPDDLFQEGMIGLYKAVRDYQPGSSSFWSFARLCITRNIITAVKGTTRQKHIPLNFYTSLHRPISDEDGDRTLIDVLQNQHDDDPETLVLDREHLRSVRQKIRQVLSQFEYQVFQLYVKGMSYQEMANMLATRPKSIDNALCRIKTKLERCVG
jgi:RNA polymerase sporulation-specific sigma factor